MADYPIRAPISFFWLLLACLLLCLLAANTAGQLYQQNLSDIRSPFHQYQGGLACDLVDGRVQKTSKKHCYYNVFDRISPPWGIIKMTLGTNDPLYYATVVEPLEDSMDFMGLVGAYTFSAEGGRKWEASAQTPYLKFSPNGEIRRADSSVNGSRVGISIQENIIKTVLADSPADGNLTPGDQIQRIVIWDDQRRILNLFDWAVNPSTEALVNFIRKQKESTELEFYGRKTGGSPYLLGRVVTEQAEFFEWTNIRAESQFPKCEKHSVVDYAIDDTKPCMGSIYSAEHIYIGEFVAGKYHGLGTQFFFNGDYYAGEFESGKFSGRGTYVYFNGGIFSGTYGEGQELRGKHWLPNGDEYEGEFKVGLPHGLGTYYHADGRVWTGLFEKQRKKDEMGEEFTDLSSYKQEVENLTLEIQNYLKDNRYLDSDVDGIIGNKTINAFNMFVADWDPNMVSGLSLNHLMGQRKAWNIIKSVRPESGTRCSAVEGSRFGVCLDLQR